MATSYEIGQYRYNSNYDYINLISTTTENSNIKSDCIRAPYKDIKIKLPETSLGQSIVQYGQTYYMELTIPQDYQCDMKINLKLCPDNNNDIDTSRFQTIRQLIIPSLNNNNNNNNVKEIIFYDNPNSSSVDFSYQFIENNDRIGSNKVYRSSSEGTPYLSTSHIYYLAEDFKGIYRKINGEDILVTKNNNFDEPGYYQYATYGGTAGSSTNPLYITWRKVNSKIVYRFDPFWMTENSDNNSTNNTITFKFAFSPKYNLAMGYKWLLLEIDRSAQEQQNIQYIDNDLNTYHGSKINLEDVEMNLYAVSNLLERGSSGQSQIQSGTNSLSYIAIWGHPEQILTINGEEIKIGQSGFYELNDFTINNLGVVAAKNSNTDRFTIDYKYKIIT